MLRALLSRFRQRVVIELTGEVFAPKPGQVLVYRTSSPLTHKQREDVLLALQARFGSTARILVLAGDGELSLQSNQGELI